MYKCNSYLTLSAISCFFACFVLAFPLPADAILMNLSIRTRDKQKTNILSGTRLRCQ